MKLDPTTLQSMYPAPSEDFARRMAQLPQTVKTKEAARVKRLLPRPLVIALLIALALSTTAYALTQPAVLDWLLGAMGSGSAQLHNTAQEITASATAEGVTIRITGAVYDGSQLAISYEAENAVPDLPVIVALDSCITVGGISHELPHPEYITELRMVPSPHLDVLPVQRNPVTGGFWSGTLPQRLYGQVECEVTFIVYRPEEKFAVVLPPDDWMLDPNITGDAKAEVEDSLATLESFRNAVIVPAEEDIPIGYTPVDPSGSLRHNAESSHLIETARITVPFTFDADKAVAYDFSGAQAEFADFTVHAASFRLTPLRTYVDMRLIPRENSRSAALALAERCGPYTLTDDKAQPVVFSDMDYCSSLLPYVTCMDGQWVCRYLIDMPGLLTFPNSVGFAVQTGELLRLPLR